jgi:hypothetical protein
MTRNMYKNRAAFNVHNTKKHKKPISLYDQLKVAQFALKEEWLANKGRKEVMRYPCGDRKGKVGDKVPSECVNAIAKGDLKACEEFGSFLQRKFPNHML